MIDFLLTVVQMKTFGGGGGGSGGKRPLHGTSVLLLSNKIRLRKKTHDE